MNIIHLLKIVQSYIQRRGIIKFVRLSWIKSVFNRPVPFVLELKYKQNYMDFALEQASRAGLFLEFGVWKGASINYIADKLPEKTIYGFDSFEGLPEDWRESGSEEEKSWLQEALGVQGFVKGAFSLDGKLPKVRNNVQLIKGWFDQTLPAFLKQNQENVAFIHMDCDLYASTLTVLTALADRIQKGAIIVFDEYCHYPGWEEGEFKAFKEFTETHHIKFKYIASHGQKVAIKIK